MRIAVCLITFRRPEGLRRLLEGLDAQTFEGPAPELHFVVVDNDEAGGARALCDELRPRLRHPLVYDIEPRRGIPFARNRAVALARPLSDWIAFIDDDEVPAPDWLAELIRIQQSYDADVVTGPVVPRFSGEVPSWAERGRFFDRLRYATGTRRDRAFTNNVLFRCAIFDGLAPHFDERMAMTGGSDAQFSLRVHRAGFKIIWADEALVYETLPPSRVTPRWVYQRAYRIGTTTAFIHRDLRGLLMAAGIVVPIAGYRILKGCVQSVVGLAVGRHVTVAGVRQICYGGGMLVGLVGGRYHEYRTTHGT